MHHDNLFGAARRSDCQAERVTFSETKYPMLGEPLGSTRLVLLARIHN